MSAVTEVAPADEVGRLCLALLTGAFDALFGPNTLAVLRLFRAPPEASG